MDRALLAALATSLLVLNGMGFLLAAADKKRAGRGARRVPENTFHILGFLGAWPGLLLAFLAMRHKTRKTRFQVPFVLASGLGTGLWAWLLWSIRS